METLEIRKKVFTLGGGEFACVSIKGKYDFFLWKQVLRINDDWTDYHVTHLDRISSHTYTLWSQKNGGE